MEREIGGPTFLESLALAWHFILIILLKTLTRQTFPCAELVKMRNLDEEERGVAWETGPSRAVCWAVVQGAAVLAKVGIN